MGWCWEWVGMGWFGMMVAGGNGLVLGVFVVRADWSGMGVLVGLVVGVWAG